MLRPLEAAPADTGQGGIMMAEESVLFPMAESLNPSIKCYFTVSQTQNFGMGLEKLY